ncbi:molybdopterin dinucleotide binding domain-containing protein [Archaeoglobus sp.]
MEFTLITVRTMEQGIHIDEKLSEEYLKATSYCEMNEDDMKELGLKEGDKVKITTEWGSVVLYVRKPTLEIPKGVVVVPMGFHANRITQPDSGSGTPFYKGLRCKVEKVEEDVPTIDDLLREVIK